jgi:hypothetical protein
MTSTKLTSIVPAAFVLALTAHGADAAFLTPAAGVLKESAAGISCNGLMAAIILASVAR